MMLASSNFKSIILPGYIKMISDSTLRMKYTKKLELIALKDPYKLPKEAWQDDVDLWPSTTYIHVGTYLVFSPNPYTSDDLLNYKSMECYQRLVDGWVRDILVMAVGDREL